MTRDTAAFSDPWAAESSGGRNASSTEDFWMFFSFAMLLLVFVLMNYVSYLYSMVVKAPVAAPQHAAVHDADVTAEEPTHLDIRVYVKPAGAGVTYTFADDTNAGVPIAGLSQALQERLTSRGTRPARVFVHAPGDVRYQHVFDAGFPAWQLSERGEPVDVHFVYEGHAPIQQEE
jgi:biopolymer transport protein ExbD